MCHRIIAIYTAQFISLMPYPGTEAYDCAKENGYILGDFDNYDKEDENHNTVLNLPELSTKDMTDFCDYEKKILSETTLYLTWIEGWTNRY